MLVRTGAQKKPLNTQFSKFDENVLYAWIKQYNHHDSIVKIFIEERKSTILCNT